VSFDDARRGESAALAGLFREYHGALLRYLRSRRVDGAEDVASDVWIDVARGIGRFEGQADDFRRWLFTIAHHRSVDAVRRSVRRAESSLDGGWDTTRGFVDGADVESEKDRGLDRAIAMVASLPDNMAEAVMLRVVNDLPISDVAEIMGTSDGNVRVLVHRGVERLRRKFVVTDRDGSTMSLVP